MLERKITQPSNNVDRKLVYGFITLPNITDVPRLFGEISKKILHIITHTSNLTIVFQRYNAPIIKNNEYIQRLKIEQRSCTITRPEQVKPADFTK